jgi:hypothetical protein
MIASGKIIRKGGKLTMVPKIQRIIAKVNVNKGTGQLTVTVPRNKDIAPGDYVSIKKIELVDLQGNLCIGVD